MNLFEEKFLANSMNSLTQQQPQETLLKIEEAFPLTPLRTWAQVQSKVQKMLKKLNQLNKEHGESDAGQCKWPWFEPCLMIWGKTTKARLVALLEAWTMVFQLIRWVDLRRSLSTWRILKNMMLSPPNRQVPPFAGNSSQGSKTPPHTCCQQLARSQGCHNHVRDSKRELQTLTHRADGNQNG